MLLLAIADNSQARQRCLNPLNYGLSAAQNGVERYTALLRCHQDAVSKGLGVSYDGIKDIELDIPDTFNSIPLSEYTDFASVTITVRNVGKSNILFEMASQIADINITGKEIDNGNYQGNEVLRKGNFLLMVEDATPWVKQRTGYEYGAVRRDVFFISNGKTNEKPISSYQTSASKPKGKYCRTSTSKKTVKNLNFIRTEDSTAKTYCIKVQNQYNVELDNITIVTPEDEEKYGDTAIQIENSVNVTLNDISIHGTYSQKKKFGYGISMNNVNGLKVNRMYARAQWGVFGTNNLQNAVLRDCDINRFDIHCYGRNVKAIGCKFSGLYNQFSSIFGVIEFDRCVYTDFVPILIESSYNAYTPFNLIWKDCTFYLNKTRNYLLTLFGVPEAYNERPELRRKCLPNIKLERCKVVLDADMKQWYLINTGGGKYQDKFDYITEIAMKNTHVVGNTDMIFKLCNEQLNTTMDLKVDIDIRHE